MSHERARMAMMREATYRSKDESTLGFPRGKTALLVIDPVNDFLSEGGTGYPMTKGVIEEHNVVENIRRAIEAARAHGVPVLYGPMAYTKEDYADEALQRRSGINRVMFERGMFLAGTWGADIHPDLKPREGDVVLQPHKSLDVFETDLPEHLERMGITHLAIAGMTANLCCESTGRHAMERGYDVTFIADAIGAAHPAFWDAAVKVNYPLIANAVITAGEFEHALEAPPEGAGLREGDTIRASDREEIGKVDKVVRGGARDHVIVKRGLLGGKPAYIPLEAISKRVGDEAFLHIPKPLVDAMGWEREPRPEAEQEKFGESRASVDKLYHSMEPTGPPGQERVS